MNVPSISTIGFSTLIFSKAMVRGKAMTATATRNQKITEIVTKSVKKKPSKNTSKGSGRSRAAQNTQTTGDEEEVRPKE